MARTERRMARTEKEVLDEAFMYIAWWESFTPEQKAKLLEGYKRIVAAYKDLETNA